jgi:hypothetical protein
MSGPRNINMFDYFNGSRIDNPATSPTTTIPTFSNTAIYNICTSITDKTVLIKPLTTSEQQSFTIRGNQTITSSSINKVLAIENINIVTVDGQLICFTLKTIA